MSLLTMSAQLAEGFLITVEIFVLTLLFSLPLGLIVAFGRMSGCKVIRIISKIYISIMRGTPLMLQIIVVYFAPFYVFRMQVGTGYRFPAVILAFVINYAATTTVYGRPSSVLSSIMRHILQRSTVRALSPYRWGSMRLRRCWATARHRLS